MSIFQITDLVFQVSLHIQDTKTWLAFSLLNKNCAQVSYKRQTLARKTLPNHLWLLVKKYPNITWDIVESLESKLSNKPWNWDGLFDNKFTKK